MFIVINNIREIKRNAKKKNLDIRLIICRRLTKKIQKIQQIGINIFIQTKLKLCYLVKKLGWKASSASKLLKIKGSTGKMMLRNFKHPNLDDLNIFFQQENSGNI